MPKHPPAPQPRQLRGEVSAFNVSPKGHFEGVLVATASGLAQVNFPKHDGETLARTMKVGKKVALTVELHSDDEEHPVYHLANPEAEVSGKVTRLNYALHGEVNGCQLDDGTFVHLKPEGAKKHKLRVGDRVTATGEKRVGPDAVVIEAKKVAKVTRGASA